MKYMLWIIIAAALCAARGPGLKKGAVSAVTWRMDSVSDAHLAQLYRSIGDSAIEGTVAVRYPVFSGGPVADSLNAGVLRTIATAFGYEGAAPETVTAVVDTVVRDLATEEFSDWGGGYDLITWGEVVRYGGVIAVRLSIYTYLGGAHGCDRIQVRNYDARTGRELSPGELFSDLPRLEAMNRAAFLRYLQEEGNERDEDLDASYLFIPVDSLPLPQNILLDSAGVQIYYNPYEIACYAFGRTFYTLPMAEAAGMLGEIYQSDNPTKIERPNL